jgi:hypothetical protein
LWRIARIALGELHFWSSAASGWARRSFFVRFSYAFRALLKMSWKLEDEVAVGVAVVGWEWDMAAGVKNFVRAWAERLGMMEVRRERGHSLVYRKPWETIRPDAIDKRAKLAIRKNWNPEVITMPRS